MAGICLGLNVLTHIFLVLHVSLNWAIIALDDGLPPVLSIAIIEANVYLSSITLQLRLQWPNCGIKLGQ